MTTYTKLKKCSSDCHVFTFDPKKVRFDVSVGTPGKLERLSSITGEPKTGEYIIAKMNGGFFSSGSEEAIGTFVDENLYYNGATPMYPTAVFTNEYKLLIEHSPDQKRHVWYQQNAFFAIGCPWTLVVDGKKNFTYNRQQLIAAFGHPYQKHPRTMFGQKANGDIVWVVVDGRSTKSAGIDIDQQAELMLEIGCVTALNLDGGGSSEMIYNGSIVNNPSDKTERRIGTALLAYAKKDTTESMCRREGTVTASSLNVRSIPSSSGTVVTTLSNGAVVSIVGVDSNTGWYQLGGIVPGNNSYVSNNYITLR